MNCYINALHHFLEQNPPGSCCPNIVSLLDMLCCCYHQNEGIDSAAVRAYFEELYRHLKKTLPDQADTVMEDAAKLCGVYEKIAFRQGLLAGFHLYRELTDHKALR